MSRRARKGNRTKGLLASEQALALRGQGTGGLQTTFESTVAYGQSQGLGTKDEGENKMRDQETGPARWYSTKGDAAKPDDLRSGSGAHRVEEENQFL